MPLLSHYFSATVTSMNTSASPKPQLQLLEDPNMLTQKLFQALWRRGVRHLSLTVPGFEEGVSNGRISIGVKHTAKGLEVRIGIPMSEPETEDFEVYAYRGVRNLYSRTPVTIVNSQDVQEKVDAIVELTQKADVHFEKFHNEKKRQREFGEIQNPEAVMRSVLGFTMTPAERIREKSRRVRGRILAAYMAGTGLGIVGGGAYFDMHRMGEFIEEQPAIAEHIFSEAAIQNFPREIEAYERMIDEADREGEPRKKIMVEIMSRIYGAGIGTPLGLVAGGLGLGIYAFYRRKKGPKHVDQM